MEKTKKRNIKNSQSKIKPGSRAPKRAKQQIPWWLIVAGVAVVAVVIVGVAASGKSGSSPAEISIQQAYAKYQSGTFLLDVRTQQEWDDYHAPNTTLIPLDQLPNRLDELPRDQEIVVVCRSGNRSQEGRDILLQAGFEQVSSMSGGLSAWRTAGYPIEP